MIEWYIIHTLSGAENRVKEMIVDQILKHNMQEYFGDIIVPLAEVVEIRRGKLSKVEKKLMPSYIFIQMKMNDKSWHLIKGVPKVTGFLGGKSSPKALNEEEVRKLLEQLALEAKGGNLSKLYEIGEQITVTDGPFDTFTGIIEEVDNERQRVRVSISIFGKPTRLDLNFNQVKKDKKSSSA